MFSALTLRGRAGRLVWGYRTAAELSTWTIARPNEPNAVWTLTATVARVDRYSVLQRPLLFYAPRKAGSHWCWPVHRMEFGESTIVARLGPPEH